MHRLIRSKVSFLNSPAGHLKTLFPINKAGFSKRILEEGEYIEGDFELSNQIKRNENNNLESKKNFANLDSFKRTLIQAHPKQGSNQEQAISDSLKSLQEKLKFNLAEGESLSHLAQQKK
jgi:hypothetical protein